MSRIGSLKKLAVQLGVTQSDLLDLSARAPKLYRSKLKQKKNKPHQYRELDDPARELKIVQRRINRRILRNAELPRHVIGGVRGKQVTDNAALHCGARKILNVDLKSFFQRVTHKHVYRVWISLGYSPDLARVLTQLTTVKGRLPQGAPTSTALANHAILGCDEAIITSLPTGWAYSRWVDDITISGESPQDLLPLIVDVFRQDGFAISSTKTRVFRKDSKQEVTGLTTNGSVPSKPRSERDNVRSAIFQLADGRPGIEEFDARLSSIRGRVINIEMTNTGSARTLRKLVAANSDYPVCPDTLRRYAK